MSANRIVVILSPIFIGVAGWVVTLAAKYLPGHPHLDQSQLATLFIVGVSAAAAKVLLWLHGAQKAEARQDS